VTGTSELPTAGATAGYGPVAPADSAHAVLYPLALGEAEITGGLWAERRQINHQQLLPGGVDQLEAAGNFDNLRAAAGLGSEPFRGPVFMDSDVYKWLEAVGWELGRRPDPWLTRQADAAIGLVAAAQEPDGYINSYYQVARPGERFSNLAHDHELY
jgi:DUF1680 family protein